jgi:hypothetical protein
MPKDPMGLPVVSGASTGIGYELAKTCAAGVSIVKPLRTSATGPVAALRSYQCGRVCGSLPDYLDTTDPVDKMPAQQVESLGWGWAAALAGSRRSSVADREIAGKELSWPGGVFASIPRTKVSRPGSRKFRKD